MNLKQIKTKLEELAKAYAKIYPAFYVAQLAYTDKRAELLLGEVGLASQPLRDASVEKTMSLTPEYIEYHKLFPEINVITKQMWVYTEIAKLLRASQFEKPDYE